MNWTTTARVCAILMARSVLGDAPLYSQDFTKAALGDPPEDVMILEGQFTVKEEAGNRFLELPGAPLETYGLLFGSSRAGGVQAQARIWGTKAGRKQPVFALGLNGQGGFKLRVSPAKQVIELLQGDEVLRTAPFQWQSGDWTSLRLQVRPSGSGVTIEAKAWQGPKEPETWTLQIGDRPALPAGKAGVWGLPFSGTALRFDDLAVVGSQVNNEKSGRYP